MSEKTFVRQESSLEVGEFLIDSKVWVKTNNEDLFTHGIVKSIGANSLSIDVNGICSEYPIADCLNFLSGYTFDEVDDLIKIPHSNSAIVSNLLRDRFLHDKIYTYAGKLLIALNPFKQIPDLYSNELISKYRKSNVSRGWPSELPPHSFAVGQLSLYGLRSEGLSQSCIVSGESGSGKTETAKQIMKYLNYSESKQRGEKTDSVQSLILGSNPLLESLGNAKTIRNNNSSRFGKFIMLDVGVNGGLQGCKICTYMLELVRIEFQSENERNYHIFYQLLRNFGDDSAAIQSLGLKKMEEYKFLNANSCYDIDDVDDCKDFLPVKTQLEKLFAKETDQFYKSLSAVLLTGNIEFQEQNDTLNIVNTDDFAKLSELLGVDSDNLALSILTRNVIVNNETISTPSTLTQAKTVIRTIAKDLYNRLFNLCIETLNNSIEFDISKPWIGILDIYGFEFFKRNTFEQLLINYANERLQQHFIKQSFKAQIEEYEREAIDYSLITFNDNSNVISIFDKPNLGIFSFLQEQCLIQTGTPASFTSTCNKHIKENCFIPSKGSQLNFSIRHTAATVKYETDEFVDKNRHKLPAETLELLMSSLNPIIKKAYADVDLAAKGKFVASTFQQSMNQLMQTLSGTKSHFIRCIKSNEDKVPHKFDTFSILNQLVSLSIFDSIHLVHSGFAANDIFQDFINKNALLIKDAKDDPVSSITSLLTSLGVKPEEYRIGKTKLFLRKSAWLTLDTAYKKMSKLGKPLALYLSCYYAAYKAAQRIAKVKELLIRLQSLYRRELVFRKTKSLIEACNSFVGLVLLFSFMNDDIRRFVCARLIQSVWRGYSVRKALKRNQFGSILLITRKIPMFRRNVRRIIERKAATKIQAMWRRYIPRKNWILNRDYLISNKSASVIQRAVKKYLYKKAYLIIRKLTGPTISIQACWRGYITRKKHSFYLLRRGQKKLEAEWLFKRLAKTLLVIDLVDRFKSSLTTLQNLIHKQSLKFLFKDILRSTVLLQSFCRTYLVKLQYGDVIKSRLIASTRKRLEKLVTAELAVNFIGKNRIFITWCGFDFNSVYPSGWSIYVYNSHLSAAGKYHTILYNHPEISSLGVNYNGCLGGNFKIATVPRTILSLTSPILRVVSISCGEHHTLLLINTGLVLAWGDNRYSQVYGSAPYVSRPVVVPLNNPVIYIQAGRYLSGAIDMAGNALFWGKGTYFGLNSNIVRPMALQCFNNILKTSFCRGDVVKFTIGDDVIFLLDYKQSVISISKAGVFNIETEAPNSIWAYHKTGIILSNKKLYHIDYRNILVDTSFSTGFKLINDVIDISIGWREILVLCEDHVIIIKEEEVENESNITEIRTDANPRPFFSITSPTVSATVLKYVFETSMRVPIRVGRG